MVSRVSKIKRRALGSQASLFWIQHLVWFGETDTSLILSIVHLVFLGNTTLFQYTNHMACAVFYGDKIQHKSRLEFLELCFISLKMVLAELKILQTNARCILSTLSLYLKV